MSGAKAESGTSVMGRVAHPAKVLVESCHALNQAVVDETPEASISLPGFEASPFVGYQRLMRGDLPATRTSNTFPKVSKGKARRNDSLTLYLSSSVRRSRLATAPPLPPTLRMGSRAVTSAQPPLHRTKTRERMRQNACGAPVYQTRKTRRARST